MCKTKTSFFPPLPSTGAYKNPYCKNYIDSITPFFEVLDKDKVCKRLLSGRLLAHSLKADVFILNWVETVPHLKGGVVQFLLTYLSFVLIKRRGAEIVWMFHNKIPHQGETKLTRTLSNWLFKHASLIISHSKEAAEYAQQRSNSRVLYRCHPVKIPKYDATFKTVEEHFDVFIWGQILPYKGIYEFVNNPSIRDSRLKIKIVGVCKDAELDNKIKSCLSSRIHYENRRADFREIAFLCKNSKYVLFPYIGNCVSSSGALIDTIAFGGHPIGPNIGAFKDLADEGVCTTYQNSDDLLRILNSAQTKITDDTRRSFMEENTWERFGDFMHQQLSL